jgi:hypothetical protein
MCTGGFIPQGNGYNSHSMDQYVSTGMWNAQKVTAYVYSHPILWGGYCNGSPVVALCAACI